METPAAERLFPRDEHGQAGHAALHALELADVDDDRRRSPSRRRAPPCAAPRRPSAPAPAEQHDVRAALLGYDAHGGSGEVSSSARSAHTIVPSGSAVTADLRCSTARSGTGTTVGAGGGRGAGGCPRRSSGRRGRRRRCRRPEARRRRRACPAPRSARCPVRARGSPARRPRPPAARSAAPGRASTATSPHDHHRVLDERRIGQLVGRRRLADLPARAGERLDVPRVLLRGQLGVGRRALEVGDDAVAHPRARRAHEGDAL